MTALLNLGPESTCSEHSSWHGGKHIHRRPFAVYRSVGVTSGKSTATIAFVRRISHFFHRTSFLLERTTDRQITITQTWIFGRHFLKKKKERTKLTCHFKENNWQNLLPMIKLKLSSENWNFGKLASATVSSLAPQFWGSGGTVVILTNVILILYNVLYHVNIHKICITQGASIFRMTSAWQLKIMVKDLFQRVTQATEL